MNSTVARRAEIIWLLLLTLNASSRCFYPVRSVSLAENSAGEWLGIKG